VIFSEKTLEFNKILNIIEKYAYSSYAKEAILSLPILTDLNTITQLLSETTDAKTAILRHTKLSLDSNYEIDEELKRLKINLILTIPEVLKMRNFLETELKIFKYQKELKRLTIPSPYLDEIFNLILTHKEILEKINQTIDYDGLIFDGASKELAKIRKSLRSKQNSLLEKLEKVKEKYQNYLNEKTTVIRNDRYCLVVLDSYKNKVKGVIHDFSSSKRSVYIEPDETREITQAIEELKLEEAKEILKILAELTNYLYDIKDDLTNNLEVVKRLDIIFAKAEYATIIDAYMPNLNQTEEINLIKARHPLLDQNLAVPIDFKLEKTQKIMLITGPNTGGKTVALKTIGLLTLMTQAGILIPAFETSNIKIFENVYADIGDEQSLEQSLSTFSSHMTKIINTVNNATQNDLILIDELGSGTDPVEGTALAISIIDYLKKLEVCLIVTTHYSELKFYAYETPGIITASVAFDIDTLKPLYYLQTGISGSSNALLISKRLGLKKEILENSQILVSGRKTDNQKMLEKLHKEREEVERLKHELLEEKNKLNKEILDYQNLSEKMAIEQTKTLNIIKDQESKLWEKRRLELDQVIKELKQKNSLSVKEESEFKQRIKIDDQTKIKYDYDFKVGDYVLVVEYQQTGKIIKIKDDKYTVDLGRFSLDFKKEALRLTARPVVKKTKTRPKRAIQDDIDRTAKLELDLRGKRYDEVEALLDKAIDNSLLSGIKTLTVIHGFGTGAVKKAVLNYLKSSTLIASYRSGGEHEGMLGVTVISLK
jgi:DNA mismatch repair protein MutS2